MIGAFKYFPTLLSALLLMACMPAGEGTVTVSGNPGSPTAENAVKFVANSERQLEELGLEAERMAWVYNNFITEDTEKLVAISNARFTAKQVELGLEAAGYVNVEGIDFDTARKLDMLRNGITMPAPRDADKIAEQSEIGAKLRGMYGGGKYCFADGKCLDLGHLSDIMAESRDPDTLLEAWNGWRTVSAPMKDLYARQVELANEGAIALGYTDLGTMWRSAYDMPPENFPAELDRLWGEVKPLYESLHCHVRAKLGEQ